MSGKILTVFAVLIIGFVIGLAVNLFTPLKLTGFFANSDDISSKVENLYELVNPGIDISVVKVDELSGIYKVLFKAIDPSGTTNYREAYITKDGELLTESMILVSQSINQLTKIDNFINCLDNKGVKIFGLVNHTATALQFNILGGSYATKLYGSCDGELAQKCIDAGITEVPSVVYNGQIFSGAKPIDWFQNLTGCIL